VECRILGFGRNTRVKTPLWRCRRIWDDNNNIVLREMECDIMHWIEMTHEMEKWRALVNAVIKLRVP